MLNWLLKSAASHVNYADTKLEKHQLISQPNTWKEYNYNAFKQN